MSQERFQQKSHLIGIGLDENHGHRRITQATDFTVLGGSEATHDKIAETLIKTFEALKKTNRTLEEINPEELNEILIEHSP